MPITAFQHQVLALLRQNRNPNSYVAGGIAIHRSEHSTRYSNDIDFFHDTDEAVSTCYNSDRALLSAHGYGVRLLIDQPNFIRAVVAKSEESLKLEWVRDTAFRFYPVIDDDDLGYRLHDADLAINKCLALANRNEVRDIIDLVHQHRQVMSLGAICWAACGKDPGFTPQLLLSQMRRNSIIRQEHLVAEALTEPVDPIKLKQNWIDLLDQAASLCESLPSRDLGCIYLNTDGSIIKIPTPDVVSEKIRHFGSVGGAWPRLVSS